MNFIQVSIEASEEQQEVLIGLLDDLGATGFEQKDDRLLAYFNEEDFPSYDVQSLLNGYNFQSNTIPQQNWNEEWENNFQPVVVDDFCAVRAHFHAPISIVKHEIVITPKMSFGTGHHATTYMMMQQMQNIDFNNKSVFDFGTGTGILAILAEKCGAKEITAIDNDEWSYKNAEENIEMNGCKNVFIQQTSLFPSQKFDIILANINRNIILQYLPHLNNISKEDTIYLFSGLLKSDETDIVNAAEDNGLQLLNIVENNNWISIIFSSSKRNLL
jgi:ribosomal protein L11 methyltransferase